MKKLTTTTIKLLKELKLDIKTNVRFEDIPDYIYSCVWYLVRGMSPNLQRLTIEKLLEKFKWK